MNRASQILHGSADKWLTVDSKQQLYWVAAVSCALLIGVQGYKLVQSRLHSPALPPDAVAADSVSADSVAVSPGTAPAPVQESEATPVATSAVAASGRGTTPASTDDNPATSVSQVEIEQRTTVVVTREITQRLEPEDNNATSSSISAADEASPPAAFVTPASTAAESQAPLNEATLVDSTADDSPETVSASDEAPPFFFAFKFAIDQQQQAAQNRAARNRALAFVFGTPVEDVVPQPSAGAVSADDAVSVPLAQVESARAFVEGAVPPQEDAPGSAETAAADNVASDTVSDAAETTATTSISETAAATAETNTPTVTENNVAEEPRPLVLVLVNPVESGGAIFYLVDGESFALDPGESHRLSADRERTISFHRGDDFGDAEVALQAGEFTFRVSSQGWQLEAATAGSAR